jgi:nicotinamide-nucleotide amidase
MDRPMTDAATPHPSPFDTELLARADALVKLYMQRGWMLATAESCTGGLVAGLLTEIAGSSAVVERGFVTYSNAAKEELLGVPRDMLERHGAVSGQVARAMAEGALARSAADVAVAITGIAGPGGGTAEKPVGLVHFATAARTGQTQHAERRFGDLGRSPVRRAAILTALDLLEARLG